ncbi:hypothetical protein KIW84_045228 [Lathyrus oleraceus]|uniref:DUF7745 domain-containing protein n=1 Tax=Pisum sativum TaxID=3888 RepID=A0A9D5AWY1_PEA|nr:hypothetical protein KIW84_045228 [Pisum sativum]
MHSWVNPLLLSPQSKIRIPCGIECPSYKQVCFSSSLQDDECFGSEIQFTLWSVTYYIPSNRYPWCSLLSAPYYDLGPPVESDFPEFVTLIPVTSHFLWCFLSEVFLLLLPQESACVSPMDLFSFGILFPSVSPSLPSEVSSLFSVFSNQSRVLFTLCQFCLSPTRVLSESLFLPVLWINKSAVATRNFNVSLAYDLIDRSYSDEYTATVTGGNQKVFVDQYGDLLTLLKMVVDPVPLQTLLQLYDPELRCFTFQDYQLAPTLEEYSILMNVPIRYQVPFLDVPKEVDFRVIARALYLSIKEVSDNWKSSGDVVGLPLKYLVRMAKEEAKKGNWESFHAQLAIMIYGIVLFPSMPNFVDLAAITIFIGGNPDPTLLADTYYAIHSRHGKGGAIRCCLPLLLRWFLSLLPTSGPFVDTQSTRKWTQRIMSLTFYDIRWQSYRMDVRNVIMSCGEFRNVPLIGTKGCINYNPVLSLRQLGFVMNGRPLDAEIAESVYFEKRIDPARLEQVGRAWKTIGVKDGVVIGKKFAVAMPDYIEWVKNRVETLLLPYDRMESLQEQPPLILAESVPAEHYKQALMENCRLKEKEQDTQMELYKAKADKLNLAHQLKSMQGEDASRLKSKKRSYEEIEAMLNEEHRECLRLQKAEANYQKKIRDLERQLRDKDIQLKKEVDLRRASESQLGGEVVELRRQLKEKLTPLPECSECDLLIDQCQYLKTLIPGGHLS